MTGGGSAGDLAFAGWRAGIASLAGAARTSPGLASPCDGTSSIAASTADEGRSPRSLSSRGTSDPDPHAVIASHIDVASIDKRRALFARTLRATPTPGPAGELLRWPCGLDMESLRPAR